MKDRETDRLRDKGDHVNNLNQWWVTDRHQDKIYMSKVVFNKMIWLPHSVEDSQTEIAEPLGKGRKEEQEEPILLINPVVDSPHKEEETSPLLKIDQI